MSVFIIRTGSEMSVRHVLLLCFTSVIRDWDAGLADATTLTYTEGSSVRVACHFQFPGRRKFLCRNECKEEDVLVTTGGSRAQSGRYGVEYEPGTFLKSDTIVYVSITQLAKSDSGRYRCGLERPFFPDAHWEFEIRVTDAAKVYPDTVKQPEQQQTEATTAPAPKMFPKPTKQPEQQQTEETRAADYTLPLVVCGTGVVLFAVALLYKWRTGSDARRQHEDRGVEFTANEKRARCGEDPPAPTDSDQHEIYCNM